MISMKRISFCAVVMVLVSLRSPVTAKPPGNSRHLMRLCSGNGWFQNSFFCTKIVSPLKAAVCSMTVIVCGAPSSGAPGSSGGLQNTLDEGAVGPPYWVIDDVINITTFLNMTGHLTPNLSAAVSAPTVPYPQELTSLSRITVDDTKESPLKKVVQAPQKEESNAKKRTGKLNFFSALTGDQRHLKTLCSENGWLQHNFICTKIMARFKAVFCALMSIKACANENSALQNSLDGSYVESPYWIIDDAGMNITVFLNMTGYSAPNEGATVLAPTVGYPESYVNTNHDRETQMSATENPVTSAAELKPDTFGKPGPHLSLTINEAVEPAIGDLHSSTPDINPGTTSRTPEVSTAVFITEISTTTEKVDGSTKITRIYGSRPHMDHSTSQRIAEVVSNAVAEEIAKKLKLKIAEKLQSH